MTCFRQPYFCLIFPILICFVLEIPSVCAQEKIRIDANTHKIVKSPWLVMPTETKASLRGLQVVTKNIMWASGTGGTVLNTFDGGRNWRLMTIAGGEKLDVRDVHAFDEATVVAMTSGTPARIYRSTNGGLSWKVVFESTDPRVFLDSISFFNDSVGIAMADPIDDRLLLLRTTDGGLTWKAVAGTPTTFGKEAGFAASGTNMTVVGKSRALIGLGGGEPNRSTHSRVVFSDDDLRTWEDAEVSIPRHESAGIFSIKFANDQDGVLVGGDYKKPDATEGNFAMSRDGGTTWIVPKERRPPSGYRSCVSVCVDGKEVNFVTVGPNGTDLSTDLGKTWTRISNEGFNSIQFSPDGKYGWAVGADGRVARWLGR